MAWTWTGKAVAALTLTALLAGCGTATAVDEPEQSPRRASAQATLIGRVSLALDETFTAEYAWSEGGTVTVWAAADGTWRVDVPSWAHDGTIDVTVAWTTGGFFQCAAGRCVRIAGITGEIPKDYDPKVQLPFVEWLPQLLDRHLPFVITQDGDCFTLTRNTIAVDPPIPPGEWCLDEAGTILSVQSGGFGTLELAAPPAEAVATVELPGDLSDAEPLSRKAPVEPSPSIDPSATPPPDPAATPTPTPSPEPAPAE